MSEQITVAAIATLNTALRLDPVSIRQIFGHKALCTLDLLNMSPSVADHGVSGSTVEALGVINGILKANGAPPVAAQLDETGLILGFQPFVPTTTDAEAAEEMNAGGPMWTDWQDKFESSNVKAVRHDPVNNVLEVNFIRGDTIYSYAGVSETVFTLLLEQTSVGKYVNQTIIPNFKSTQVR